MYNKKKKGGKKGNRKKTVSKQPSARDAAPRPRRLFRPAGKKTGVRRAHLTHGRALDTPNCQHYKKKIWLGKQGLRGSKEGTSCDKLSCQQRALPHSALQWFQMAKTRQKYNFSKQIKFFCFQYQLYSQICQTLVGTCMINFWRIFAILARFCAQGRKQLLCSFVWFSKTVVSSIAA